MPALFLSLPLDRLRCVARWALGYAVAGLLAACSALPPLPPRTASTALSTPNETPLGRLVLQLQQQAQTPDRSGFVLLSGAEAAFGSRLALIHQATHTLDVQYYAIHADPSTARLLNALVQAAQRGVRVRVLLDDFHGAGENAQVMRLAFVPGIEMRMFNPLAGPRDAPVLRTLFTLADFPRAQQRMHNKLLIADNSMAIAGGRNLGDAYFDALDSDNFMDLDVLAAGAAVHQLSRSFDHYWNDIRAYPVQALVSQATLQQWQNLNIDVPTDNANKNIAASTSAMGQRPSFDVSTLSWLWAPAVVLADTPDKIPAPAEDKEHTDLLHTTSSAEEVHSGIIITPQTLPSEAGQESTNTPNRQVLRNALPPVAEQVNVVNGLLALIDQAQADALIVSPYFVPGSDMQKAFARARGRGVRVRILTNSLASSDAPLAHAGYARHRQALLAQGIELYELRSLQNGQASLGTLRNSAPIIGGSQGRPRTMLHAKMLVLDHALTVIGSMNLDMRSQLQNTEVAVLIASRQMAQSATEKIEASIEKSAWRLENTPQGLVWHAPPESDWGDHTSEPDASLPLRIMMHLIGPFAPDHLL